MTTRTTCPRRQLRRLIHSVQRPVQVSPSAVYREIGVRSHGRGIFHKESIPGRELGEKSVFQIEPGDLVFNIVFAWEGAVALATETETGMIGSHRFPTYRAIEGEADLRFLHWYFQTEEGSAVLDLNSPGAAGRNRTLDQWALLRTEVPAPPLEVQSTIADNLDKKTRAIDSLISMKLQLIENLEAFVAMAVSKGLNRSAATTETEIPWLGPTPTHWRLVRGRFLFRQLSMPPEGADEVVTAFRDGQVALRSKRRLEGFMVAEKEAGYQHVRRGDLVVHSMDAFAGAIGTSEDSGKCTPEYIVMEPIGSGVVTRYYATLLRVMAKRDYVRVICPSVRERAPRFRFESFKDVLLPVPPLEEQVEIAEIVARDGSGVGAAILLLEKQVRLLEEYRYAVIGQSFSNVGQASEEAA